MGKEGNDIVIYSVDDWECLYVNGEAKAQGHRIRIYDIAQYCPIERITEREANPNLDTYVSDYGRFPDTLSESRVIEKGNGKRD